MGWIMGAVLVGGVLMLAASGWVPPKEAQPYLPHIYAAERAHGLPHNLLARVLYQESRYRADIIDGRTASPAGALGIAQFMPATAAEWGIDPLDPVASIYGAARYLRWLYNRHGSWHEALAAYNWGTGNVARRGLQEAPPETVAYVRDITRDVAGV